VCPRIGYTSLQIWAFFEDLLMGKLRILDLLCNFLNTLKVWTHFELAFSIETPSQLNVFWADVSPFLGMSMDEVQGS